MIKDLGEPSTFGPFYLCLRVRAGNLPGLNLSPKLEFTIHSNLWVNLWYLQRQGWL
jgi:hypothetical protein